MLADLRNHLFRHLQRLSLGFYERNRAGVLISRLTNDVEALDQLVTDGFTSLIQNTLTLARGRRSSSSSSPGGSRSRCWSCSRRSRSRRRSSASKSSRSYRGVRETLGAVTATLAEDIAGMRVLQAFTRERQRARALPRGRRDLPDQEPRDGRPERALLPVRRPALVDRDRDHPRLRRLPRLRRADDDRRPHRLPRLLGELLRPGAAALAALQHLPDRGRGARQDHGGARRGARASTDAPGARRARARRAARCASATSTSRYEPRRRGAARDRPRRPGGDDGRARRPHRAPASRRSPS